MAKPNLNHPISDSQAKQHWRCRPVTNLPILGIFLKSYSVPQSREIRLKDWFAVLPTDIFHYPDTTSNLHQMKFGVNKTYRI
jgi:hypothetical protein